MAERLVIGAFKDPAAFRGVVKDLEASGFDHAAVSILAPHQAVEDLRSGGAMESAIRFIAESLSVIGTAAATGAAYAVGGPVGVAATTGAAVETSVEDVLSGFADERYADRLQQNLRNGALLCWVRVDSDSEARAAHAVFDRHGGVDIHEVESI